MYQNNWQSIKKHSVPEWFRDAKLGIFIHWGLYSVPAWAPRVPNSADLIREKGLSGMLRANPYSEWYMNSARVKNSLTWHHHRQTYGPTYHYKNFTREFDEASAKTNFDEMTQTLSDAGAQYVVLTTKHHDGFTLWPTKVPHPHHKSHQAKRDLVGDLTEATRRAGMRMGLYYSGAYDWSVNNAVMSNSSDSILAIPAGSQYAEYAAAHVRELINLYQPSILWNDIGWPGGGDLASLIAEYYNTVADGLINDRWAQSPAHFSRAMKGLLRVADNISKPLWRFMPENMKQLNFVGAEHADFVTPEYRTFDEIQEKPWELTRGIGNSFAYNKNEDPADISTATEIVRSLVDTVSKNGNMLLGVGPRADGSIPEEQLAQLQGLGEWMRVNGESIIRSRPWHQATVKTSCKTDVRFTTRAGNLYALLLSAPTLRRLTLPISIRKPVSTELLGAGAQVIEWSENSITVELPESLPITPVHTIRFEGAV